MSHKHRWILLATVLATAGCEEEPGEPDDDDDIVGDDDTADDDDDTTGCELADLDPGDAPPDLPEIALLADNDDAFAGLLVTSLLQAQHRPVLLAADGSYLWWGDAEPAGVTVSRATLSRDRCSVIHLAETDGFAPDEDYVSTLHWTRLDGSDATSIDVLDLHHDLVELADGTVASIAREFREIDGVWVAGDRIVEISLDGAEREVWSVWDHWDIAPAEEPQPEAIDWSHANALDFDEAADLYLISLRHFQAIAAVHRSTGETAWVLGGDHATVELLGDPALDAFHEQHQLQPLADGVLVFDNGETDAVSSRAIEYAWSGDDAVEAVWRHVPDPPINCYALGDVARLSSGHTGITWSTSGRIDEVDADGEIVRQLGLEIGAGFGYTTWVEDAR